MIHTRFPLTSKRTLLHPQNMFKVSKIVCAIAVSNEYMSKILGNYVSICPLFLTPTETLDTHTNIHSRIVMNKFTLIKFSSIQLISIHIKDFSYFTIHTVCHECSLTLIVSHDFLLLFSFVPGFAKN